MCVSVVESGEYIEILILCCEYTLYNFTFGTSLELTWSGVWNIGYTRTIWHIRSEERIYMRSSVPRASLT